MLKNKKKLRRQERRTPGYAARTAQTLVLAGALLVGGVSVATAASPWGPAEDVVITTNTDIGANSAEAKSLTVSGGTLSNATATGHIFVTGATVLDAGGTITLGGSTLGHGLVGVDKASNTAGTFTGSFTMNGGTLNVGTAPSDDTANGGKGNHGSQVQMDKVDIKGGVINMQGRVGDNQDWTSGSMIVAGETSVPGASNFSISGGVINMGDYAQLVVGKNGDERKFNMTISGGTINLNGTTDKEAIIRASAGHATASNAGTGSLNYAKLNISGGLIAVDAGKAGVILSRETNMSGGALDVKGTLTVAGATTLTGNILAGIGAATAKWGDFNLSGGTINVSGAGKLDFKTGNVKLNISGGMLNTSNLTVGTAMDSGTALVTGSTISGGHVQVNDTLSINSGSLSVTGTGVLTINKSSIATPRGFVIVDGISLGVIANHEGGTLVIKGFEGKTVTADDLTAYSYIVADKRFGTAENSHLDLTKYEGNNVILKDVVLNNVDKNITGKGVASAPETLNVKKDGASAPAISATGVVTAPSLTTEDNTLSNAGKLILDGAVANAGVSKVTALTSFESTGSAATTVSNGASLNVGTYTHTDGNTTVDGGASLNVDKTTLSAGTVQVLNAKASLGEFKGDGGKLFVDPAYVQIDSVSGALASKMLGGVGGVINIGGNEQWLTTAMYRADVTKDSSVLGLAQSITLGTGGQIVLDQGVDATGNIGSTPVTDQLHFGAGSLLVVDMAKMDKDFAIKSDGANKGVTIDADATLYLDNLRKVNNGFQLLDGFDALTNTNRWMNFINSDAMLDADVALDGTVQVKVNLASTVLPGLSSNMNGIMASVWENSLNDVNSANAGIRFVSRAANDDYLGGARGETAAATIEGAAQMAAVAGVQISTMGAANAASGAVTTRTSFAQPLMDMTKAVAVHQDNEGALSLDSGLSAGDGMKNGLGVWIMPLYQSNRTWGQKAENFKSGISSDLGGIALGADYTINDMFRFGAAFNVGGGYAQSSGDFNKTDNNFNFWGVNLYGGWTMNNFGLSADVGYTSNYNKVEQDMPASMAMGNLKSDITSSAWTAGLKGEYKFDAGFMDIIPHVGVRYMGLTTDSYDVKSGGTVFSVERDFQSIWTFPVGVAFNKTITSDSGWMFKPQVDLSVIPAAGDIKAKSKASIPGVMGDAEMKMQVVDYVTFDGGVGLEMGKDNLSFGVNYNIQASEHRTGHGVFGTLRYEF